ncbi:hypothetical protein GLOTRDRAFT_96690 [Gloeophyllum trabeum ATCC 11539]|uniref:Uncharacterized protein n=1 Tax=Gloeophyllum trabeum (strain ATCC 11539 / FP-39264 / Madison 617) TaxID=670483 RepID=S7RA69_GLOTA|nr:uncharacterized protein GLOTRDRAFT_96690 [Gloeophyllum trabeum ATCC 11539]EPQ51160.1 hypothetical protein GLOTRDRAFT_96690 [Gloeophyllum trabeum ATCC 11539]
MADKPLDLGPLVSGITTVNEQDNNHCPQEVGRQSIQLEVQSLSDIVDECQADAQSNRMTIDSLPTELLSEILVSSLPQHHFVHWCWVLVFTRVSRRWRAVAEATPGLWCSLDIELGWTQWPRIKLKQANLFMRMWTERSGALSLSLSLKIPSYYLKEDLPKEESRRMDCVKILKANFYRCRKLRLIAPSKIIATLPDVPTPYLESLLLLNDDNRRLMLDTLPSLANAARLQYVHLTHIDPQFSLKTFNFELLRHLILTDVRGSALVRCMDILGKCANLESLKMEVSKISEEEVDPFFVRRPRPTYAQLRKLDVTIWNSWYNFSGVLDWLLLPALRSLTIAGNSIRLDPFLTDAIIRDGSAIEHLDLSHSQSGRMLFQDEDQLVRFFKALPQLRVLRMGGVRAGYKPFDDHVLHALTYDPERFSTGEYLLPQLEEISVCYVSPYCTGRRVAAMLDSRRTLPADGPVARLREASIIKPWPWMPNTQRWVVKDGGEVEYFARQYSGNMDFNPEFCWL